MDRRPAQVKPRDMPEAGWGTPQLPGPGAPGFSLVELLVVMAIVVILAAIAVNMALIGHSTNGPQTRVLLARVQAIAENYAAEAGTAISDADLASTSETSIERFVRMARQRPNTNDMLNALDSDVLKDTDGNGKLEICDTWGNPLVYVGPTALQVANSANKFMPRPHPYFASAGSDGNFGDYSIRDGDGIATDAALKDNLYSFDAERTHKPGE